MLNQKVSVIVPVYNSATYLPMCIESIRAQTYDNLEIILVDDGSKDNSLEICKGYAKLDHRIKVIHRENGGVSAARNTGLDVSEGEYVTFVDSDDELLIHCISSLVKDIEEFGADVAMASKMYITPDQKEINRKLDNDDELTVFSGTDALKLSLEIDRRMTSCHGKLFRRQFISDIRYVEGKRINEDFYFVFLCCMKKPILTYRNEPVYKYYYRCDSATHTVFGEKYFDMLYFAEQKKALIEKHYPELLDLATNMELGMHLFMLNMLCKTTDPKYRKDEQKSIEYVKKNYKNYHTNNSFEKRMAWIVSHGLYPLYKWAFRMKQR